MANDEVVGKVLSITEDEHGVTATIRLAPGWTIERIENGLAHFFWGGPDDFDFNEIATPLFDHGPNYGSFYIQPERYRHEDRRPQDREVPRPEPGAPADHPPEASAAEDRDPAGPPAAAPHQPGAEA